VEDNRVGHLAIDVSSWSGEFTDAEAEACKALGCRLVIVNTWGEWCRQQAEMTLKHGMDLEFYTYMYFSVDPERRVADALEAVSGFPVRMFWLDYEDDPAGLRSHEVVAHIRQAVAACERQRLPVGIYTRRSWWEPYTGSCTEFARLSLWDAFYDGVPDLTYFRPYGGWTRPLIKQFTGTSEAGGQTVDFNWRDDSLSEQEKIELALRKAAAGLTKLLADLEFQKAADAMKIYLGVVAR
jgi:GH25 family lysozyme M1 (1,4-beta-N-acetylmuramidase)